MLKFLSFEFVIKVSFILQDIKDNLSNFFSNNSFSNEFIFFSKQRAMIFTNNGKILDSPNGSIRESDFKIFITVLRSPLPGFPSRITSRRSKSRIREEILNIRETVDIINFK
jgi:hypothetical protein